MSTSPNERQQRIVLRFALIFSILVFAIVGLVIMRYHPSSIYVNEEREIVLATTLGSPNVIPLDSVEIKDVPDGLLSNLIRTNGASYGKVCYGHFKNTRTGAKLFLYLTGKTDTVCFEYEGTTYVTDDWRK